MKNIQRNGIKFKVFEKDELISKLGMKQDDVDIILNYQDKFPELMMEDVEGFVIDGEKLCNQLGVKERHDNWLLRHTKGKEGKLIKYKCIENIDFKCIVEKSTTQRKDGQKGACVKNKILLTLECAKMIAMIQNNDLGILCRKYFILIEKTLKNYESWNNIRNPEKIKANEMKKEIKN